MICAATAVVALSLAPLGAVPTASATMPSITSIPVQVIRTSDGSVSYRSDGTGSSLVLIMGYSGGRERHRVIIFDNAGIGQTPGRSGLVNGRNDRAGTRRPASG